MTNGSQVEAKVANIVTPTQVAFNAGSEQGVQEGDLAEIYYIVEVIDPDTSEHLGTVRIVRLTLKISHVQVKLSVGRVIDYYSKREDFFRTNQRRKRVTFDVSKEDDSTILLKPGESVLIKRPPTLDDEPPF